MPFENPTRLAVKCLLLLWVFSLSAPSVLSLTLDDSSLLITMNANEEEPGEAEKKDATEEPLSLPESWQLTLRSTPMKEKLLLADLETPQEIIREIILPPPEFLLIS